MVPASTNSRVVVCLLEYLIEVNTLILRIMAAVTVQGLNFFGPAAFLFKVRPLIFEKLFPIIITRIKSAQWQKLRKLRVNIVICQDPLAMEHSLHSL